MSAPNPLGQPCCWDDVNDFCRPGGPLLFILETLRSDDGDGNEKVKKAMS